MSISRPRKQYCQLTLRRPEAAVAVAGIEELRKDLVGLSSLRMVFLTLSTKEVFNVR